METQHIFTQDNKFYLVSVFDGKMTLKIKEDGWSDIWSLPLAETDTSGRVK